MNEMKRIYDGDQARLVLENEAFAAAFEDIKAQYTLAWRESPARDAEGREKLYMMIKMVDKLELTLRTAMEDGRMAQIALKYQEEQAARDRAEGIDTSGWQQP